MRRTLAIAAVLGICGLPLHLAAQSNPSSQQIIDALRPSGDLLGGPTRGIRPVNPPAAAPQQAQPAAASPAGTAPRQAAPATQQAAARTAPPPAAPSVNLTVNFATGSAELTPQAMRTLDELGRALSSPDLSGFRFRVEGHTDTVGATELNQSLSERRAAAVVEYLTARFAIPAARLQAIGMGETQPVVPTRDQVPEPRNRRVQVVNIGA
ncbi:OmpA family protein [Falsiroseomonas bella]|uniref:OmpA family protein n=1 Tax=Falsiroseomonas bella TaxID=2184016 RepID=A0A317FG88_9PROT|nr:OmpA family protein [Falsiroseomonas bella]PWS38081.1 OmpA family protein [Falsiroseomonas bella]